MLISFHAQAAPALMFDAVYTLAEGLHQLKRTAHPMSFRTSNASCEAELPWLDGTSLFNYINAVSNEI